MWSRAEPAQVLTLLQGVAHTKKFYTESFNRVLMASVVQQVGGSESLQPHWRFVDQPEDPGFREIFYIYKKM